MTMLVANADADMCFGCADNTWFCCYKRQLAVIDSDAESKRASRDRDQRVLAPELSPAPHPKTWPDEHHYSTLLSDSPYLTYEGTDRVMLW